MSVKDPKAYVTEGTCKLVTDALNEKITAQKLLVDAEIKAIRMSIYSSVTTLGILMSVLQVVLTIWRH